MAQNHARERLDAYVRDVALPYLRRFAPHANIETVTEIEIPGLSPDADSQAAALALKLANSNRTIAVPFATEAGRFQSAGVSTIVCGPGSIAQAHQPNEYIEIAQLEVGIGFMRALMATMR